MATLDWLKEIQGRVLDAASYKRLQRNFEMQEQNNRLLEEKARLLEDKIADLQEYVERLEIENRDLKERLDDKKGEEEYRIHQGFAFRRGKDGKFEGTPHCPNCKVTMSSIENIYQCSKCEYFKESNIKPDVLVSQLNTVLA